MTAAPSSPWRAGRLHGEGRGRLLFGAMHEDAAVDLEILGSCRHVFAIASSGDTAMRLAREREVAAVDVNPAQVAYVQSRLAGAPRRPGTADRLLGLARAAAPAVGWTPRRIGRFLALDDPERQARIFDRLLDTARFRATMTAAFSPATLLRAYRPEFVAFLPPRFGAVLRHRLRRGFATHPNRTNPYARLLLLGEPPGAPTAANTLELQTADAADFLEAQRPASFDGFTLSNILDGPDRSYAQRLAAAVARAGTSDAPVVLRTLRAPNGDAAASWAARDRAMIWGGIVVTTAAELPAAVRGL